MELPREIGKRKGTEQPIGCLELNSNLKSKFEIQNPQPNSCKQERCGVLLLWRVTAITGSSRVVLTAEDAES